MRRTSYVDEEQMVWKKIQEDVRRYAKTGKENFQNERFVRDIRKN